MTRLRWLRKTLWLLALGAAVPMSGCGKEDVTPGASNASAAATGVGLGKATGMPELRVPEALAIAAGVAAGDVASPVVLRLVKRSANSYFYAASDADRKQILATNLDVRLEKAVFQGLAPGPASVPIYRFLRTDGSGHFLTASDSERAAIRNSPAHSHYQYEGIVFYGAREGASGATAVYRLANRMNGTHLYTADVNERASALRAGEWLDEGVGFYALPAGHHVLSGTESAERERLERLEARLTRQLTGPGGLR